jgi:hypothetical protein
MKSTRFFTSLLRGEVLVAQGGLGLAKGRSPVDAMARAAQRTARDVRGVHAQVRGRIEARLLRQHHDAVGLLTAGAAGGPHRDRPPAALPPLQQQLGKDLVDECPQLPDLTEEVGLVRRDLVDQLGELPAPPRRAPELVVVGGEARQRELSHAPLHACLEQEARIRPEVQPTVATQELREHAELRIGHAGVAGGVARGLHH